MRSLLQPRVSRRAACTALATLALGGCSGRALVAAVTPTGHYDRLDDIAYGPAERHRLDLYVPHRIPPGGAPVVLFFYGGIWQGGERELYAFVGEAFAARGAICAVADYRLYPEVRFPAFVDDGALAMAWVARNAVTHGGDPARLFIAGHSAGAHIAMLVALDTRFLQRRGFGALLAGAIGLSGPYDFLPIENPRIRAIFADADDALTQPITFARADAPPLLLLHGAEDDIVKPGNSERLAARMHALGGRAKLRIYARMGHAEVIAYLAAPVRSRAPVIDDITAFLDAPRA